ncbi:hypothetical protein J2Z21_000766 [Streptomyces griseochromogenes]|uniref:Uncharacterized protein n=1 Tax=Streptomyces griseochromogenes TaxID=68214 RepID=A0ABS4LKC6_9ACTN|nr:hypothetical protein [Streptomyces griseochromogenes]MBP2047842.1 hypothetical protein [Streptomyces griseochromogenes]
MSHHLPLLEVANRVSEAECRLALGQARDAIGILEQALVDSRRLRACRLESAAAELLAEALEESRQSGPSCPQRSLGLTLALAAPSPDAGSWRHRSASSSWGGYGAAGS